jgi:hypothetical protein
MKNYQSWIVLYYQACSPEDDLSVETCRATVINLILFQEFLL